ncbi:MAG: AEC family transporter [Burkholderiaceae bacterium]|nr:AEC family transporter [Burkholderiaceae bacterium]
MTSELWIKLLVLFVVVAMGWTAGRTRLLGGGDTVRVLSNLAFYLFTPALLFRATARIDFATMPWGTLLAFFGPAVVWMLVVYALNKRKPGLEPATPAVRAISASFGNTVQLGLPIWPLLDAGLQMLGSAVVPMCLVLIGLSLAHYGVKGAVGTGLLMTVGKMLCMPLLVLAVGHWLLGESGVPLAVIVLGAALPVGSNALLFAQRYQAQEAQATAAIVISTLAFVVMAPAWLSVLAWLG